jgi:C_GCAxxG_C_C family probable redox protein
MAKIDADSVARRASEIYASGVCCSESVVYAFAEIYDPENVHKYLRMASGLCGGMGTAATCGIVTGGACVIGMFLGRDSIEETPLLKCSSISKVYYKMFLEKFNETGCKELKAYAPKGAPVRGYCQSLVEGGCYMLAELINEQNKQL